MFEVFFIAVIMAVTETYSMNWSIWGSETQNKIEQK